MPEQKDRQSPSSPHQSEQDSDSSRAIKWILVLVGGSFVCLICAGALVGIAIPSFMKFINRSKAAEAEAVLTETRMNIKNYYQRNGELPGLEQMIKTADQPPTEGNKYTPDSSRLSSDKKELWQTLGWTTEPKYFQYLYEATSTESGAKAALQARADFSEGGDVHTITQKITVENGNLKIQPAYTKNEFE